MVMNSKWQTMGVFLLSAAVLLSGLFIGLSVNNNTESGPIMTLEQVSEYIDLTTEEITNIMIWEDAHPERIDYLGDSFVKFPYYVVGDKRYFIESSILIWLHNVSTRSYFNKFISLSEGWGQK